jgi:hypothetical protein
VINCPSQSRLSNQPHVFARISHQTGVCYCLLDVDLNVNKSCHRITPQSMVWSARLGVLHCSNRGVESADKQEIEEERLIEARKSDDLCVEDVCPCSDLEKGAVAKHEFPGLGRYQSIRLMMWPCPMRYSDNPPNALYVCIELAHEWKRR